MRRVEVSVLGEAFTAITDRGAFAGVYLPPSLPEASVAPLLDSLSSSDIVLGDVNVRLPKLERWIRDDAYLCGWTTLLQLYSDLTAPALG